MNDNQKQWLAKVPKIYRANYITAMSGKSRAAAIKAKCLDCTNWQRVEFSTCPVETCSLWLYRPYKEAENLQNPQESGGLEKKIVKG